MDRLDELAIFIAVVDEGGMAAAGRKLHRSGPAVTRALAALEDRVGARLVERSTRRLAPTKLGLELAARARALLADYDGLAGSAAVQPLRGLLRVTAPTQFGRRHVATLVDSFLDAFPEMQVELVLNDRNLDMIDEGIDVAVRIGDLPDSSLIARKVGQVSRILVASPAYLAERGVPHRPKDLMAHDTIFSAIWSGPREWRFQGLGAGGKESVVRLAPRFTVNDIEAQILAARAGRGIARLLCYQVADDLAAGALIRIMREYEAPPLPVQVVTGGGRHMAPKVRAFLDHAVKGLLALPVIHR
ncbi:LysR family transcriptional regulator [Oxalobacteraceae bacterium CAVE-383]|nr:LysR family transcriptional regulator [Oxalobacteraceae bacterium CAVE-383]